MYAAPNCICTVLVHYCADVDQPLLHSLARIFPSATHSLTHSLSLSMSQTLSQYLTVSGKYRMSMLLANWEILDIIGSVWGLNDTGKVGRFQNQPMWVSAVYDVVMFCGVLIEDVM